MTLSSYHLVAFRFCWVGNAGYVMFGLRRTAGLILRLLLWCLSHTRRLFLNTPLRADLLKIMLHLDMVQTVLEYMYACALVKHLHLYKNFTPSAL